jgi:beta-glucosidase
VNYYSPQILGPTGPVLRYPSSSAGWQQIHPRGLTEVLLRLHREYGAPEVVITEKGVPDAHGEDVHDPSRIAFLRDHVLAVHDAISHGARVRGFHAWSPLDSFEWSSGYTQRWGLVHVDLDPLRRTPKDSAEWYRKVATTNEIQIV